MKYQKKIVLAEKGIEFLSEGNSMNEYIEVLEKDGYFKYDIDKIISSIKNMLFERYRDELNSALLKGDINEKRSNFHLLNNKWFEDFKTQEIINIVENSKQEIRKMVEIGTEPSKIVNIVQNTYFPSEEASAYIINYVENKKESGYETKDSSITIGIILLLIGISLSMVTPLLFYGLILGGLGMIVKGLVSSGY